MGSLDSQKDTERNEDLNPRSDDIEERVKQMLDPSIPDEQEPARPKATKPKPKSKVLPIVDSADEAVNTEAAPLSAPVLPAKDKPVEDKADNKLAPSKSKKVIIPISHESDSKAEAENATPDSSTDKAELPEELEPEEVKEITLDNNDTQDDLAEKLDAAIAGLKTNASVSEDAEDSGSDTPESAEDALPSADSEEEVKDPAVITDPETDKAVDAIIADESDKLLEIEDAIRDTDEPVKAVKKTRRSLGAVLKALWARSALRWFIVVVLIAGIFAVGAVPTTRYFVLNSAGVRASSSLKVLDASTGQPLKNVKVSIGNISATTDNTGSVQLQKIHLGSNLLTVEKRAFAPVTKTVVLGLGSNPLGDLNLTPTGTQYSFTATDFLSGKPIVGVEASNEESASAISDDKGAIKLTVDAAAQSTDDQTLNITIKKDGYREEKLSLDPNDKSDHAIKLVPSRKQIFISKRSGKYDIYSVYIDGKDEKLVLAGSGHEREDNLVLVPHPTANVVAYVSNRADQRNNEGFLLSNLILINLDDNSTTNISAAERIQIVDWSKDYLVYVQIAAGTSANSPKRYRLMSYNYRDESSKELASSNFFNDVLSAGNAIYYAPSSAYQPGPTNFYKINADGSGSQVIYNKEVWNIFRVSYDHFALSVQQQWYDYKLGASAPTKLNTAPANQTTQVYVDSPDSKHSAWVDNRDGKGVLLLYDLGGKSDTTLRAHAGLAYPIRWLNEKVIIYRIKSASETADYAISIDGGDPVKIRDVTNSGGIDRWYYY